MHMASSSRVVYELVSKRSYLVRCGSRRNKVFWKSGRRRSMHHRVSVLDAGSVGAVVTLRDIHYRVIGVALGPVTLQLEHYRERRDRFRARLDNALHGVVVRELADIAAA